MPAAIPFPPTRYLLCYGCVEKLEAITVKSVNRGRRQDLKIVSAIELAYFALKTCSRMLGYSAIDPKVYQAACIRRKKNLRDSILEIIMLM